MTEALPTEEIAKTYRVLARISRRVLGTAVACLVGLSLLAVWVQQAQVDYEETAVPYLNEHLPVIASWDADSTWGLIDDDVRSDLDRGEFEKAIGYLGQLGRLEWLGDPEFQHVMAYAGFSSGAMKRLNYVIPARFEEGDARIAITLVDRRGEFNVYHFNVDSMAFADRLYTDDPVKGTSDSSDNGSAAESPPL